MFCNKCGNEISEKSKFCNKCGNKINQSSKEEKKEMSKGMRIFIIILLSILFIYLAVISLGSAGKAFSDIFNGSTSMLFAFGFVLALTIWCGYGLIKNIKKLRGIDKKELTEDQLQKRKKRNAIFGLSSITAIVLIVVIMFCYGNISESKEKEQMISKIKEYQSNGYLNWTEANYQELETYSNEKIKEILDKIESNKKLLDEYDKKYSAKLDEIFAKEIKVELYENEDDTFMYIPFNISTGARHAKTQVEYVTINKYGDNIVDIYYSVEMNLTVYNKYTHEVVPLVSGTVKKYYKIPYLRDTDKIQIDQIQKINNYNDQAILDEINRAIDGKTIVVAKPSQNKNYKYDFSNIEK